MYLYRFETDTDFQSAYNGEDYSEPGVSCTDENHQVNYNYKPHVTISVHGSTGNDIEKTFTLQKYTGIDAGSGDPYSFYYFPISAEELGNMFDHARESRDNTIMGNTICKDGEELHGSGSFDGNYFDTHTAEENIVEMNYIKLTYYSGTSTEYFTEFVTSDDESNELGTSFFGIHDRLVDSTITCSGNQIK